MTTHVRAYREIIESKQIQAMGWIDNRDMIADPLTKGKTQRNAINAVLNYGEWSVKQPIHIWPEAAVTGPRGAASPGQ